MESSRPYILMLQVLVLTALAMAGCQLRLAAVPAPQEPIAAAPLERAKVPAPDPAATFVPAGYRVEVVLTDLTYPTSAAFDEQGNLYVAEAGYSYGDMHAPARIWRIREDGRMLVLADQLNGPVNDLLWHDDRLYVSHRGKISVLHEGGQVEDLVTGLPSYGDHHNNQMSVGPDGMIYFGQGTVTNSGVVGLDNFMFLWLPLYPQLHDQSAKPITVSRRVYTTINPFVMAGGEGAPLVNTAGFSPFGQGQQSRHIEGATKANGTILRMQPDGSGLEVYAWGLRNPFGVQWGPDGRLYASDNGFDERGSRPIANAPDVLWEVQEGAWYGWPDYAGGEPVTHRKFWPAEGPRVRFLMTEHPPVEQPLMRFPPHSATTKISFNEAGDHFGASEDLFLAIWGPMTPVTGQQETGEQAINGLYRIDAARKQAELFFGNRPEAIDDNGMTAGLRRPMQATFSPQGNAMYVVDYGMLTTLPTHVPMVNPFPGTGVIWRIVPEDVEHEGPPAELSVLATEADTHR